MKKNLLFVFVFLCLAQRAFSMATEITIIADLDLKKSPKVELSTYQIGKRTIGAGAFIERPSQKYEYDDKDHKFSFRISADDLKNKAEIVKREGNAEFLKFTFNISYIPYTILEKPNNESIYRHSYSVEIPNDGKNRTIDVTPLLIQANDPLINSIMPGASGERQIRTVYQKN